MKVTSAGRDLSFNVSSEDDAEAGYVVELASEERPWPRCICTDFQTRIECFLQKNEEPPVGRRVCKHLDLVLAILSPDYVIVTKGGQRLFDEWKAAGSPKP